MSRTAWRSWAPEVATGHPWVYLLTWTPGEVVDGEWRGVRLTTPAEVDLFAERVRSVLHAAARTDRGEPALDGGFYRMEVVPHPEEGDVGVCPCQDWPDIDPPRCPVCGGSGVVPVGHVHVHAVAWASRPLWFGYDAPPEGYAGIGGLGLWGASRRRGLGRCHAQSVAAEDAARYVGKFGSYSSKGKDAALCAVYGPVRTSGKFGSARGATREEAGELLLSPEGERRNAALLLTLSMTEKPTQAGTACGEGPAAERRCEGDPSISLSVGGPEGRDPHLTPGWALVQVVDQDGAPRWRLGASPRLMSCREALRGALRRKGAQYDDEGRLDRLWWLWAASQAARVARECMCEKHRGEREQARVDALGAKLSTASSVAACEQGWTLLPAWWVVRPCGTGSTEPALWLPPGTVPEFSGPAAYTDHGHEGVTVSINEAGFAAFLDAYQLQGRAWFVEVARRLGWAEVDAPGEHPLTPE